MTQSFTHHILLFHSISISWILPEELIRGVSDGPLPASIDLYDIYTTTSLYKSYRKPTQSAGGRGGSECSSNEMGFGNLALSSCPGKKVRLSGPVRGRSAIDRDIDLDFQRLRSCGISLVVWWVLLLKKEKYVLISKDNTRRKRERTCYIAW